MTSPGFGVIISATINITYSYSYTITSGIFICKMVWTLCLITSVLQNSKTILIFWFYLWQNIQKILNDPYNKLWISSNIATLKNMHSYFALPWLFNVYTAFTSKLRAIIGNDIMHVTTIPSVLYGDDTSYERWQPGCFGPVQLDSHPLCKRPQNNISLKICLTNSFIQTREQLINDL